MDWYTTKEATISDLNTSQIDLLLNWLGFEPIAKNGGYIIYDMQREMYSCDTKDIYEYSDTHATIYDSTKEILEVLWEPYGYDYFKEDKEWMDDFNERKKKLMPFNVIQVLEEHGVRSKNGTCYSKETMEKAIRNMKK